MKQKRILIAEDDPDVLRFETRILENAGYVVDGVASGEGALEMLQQNRYTVVIADVMMPGMDGFDLTKAIRRRFTRKIPVLLVTAVPDPLTAAHQRDAKPIAAIEKPFLSQSLVTAVRLLEEQAEVARRRAVPIKEAPAPKGWIARLFDHVT